MKRKFVAVMLTVAMTASVFAGCGNAKETGSTDEGNRTDDGSLYMFPCLREDTWLCTFRGMAVRKDWLDEQGLEVPTTLTELDNVAHVFKEKYGAHFSTVVSWLTTVESVLHLIPVRNIM